MKKILSLITLVIGFASYGQSQVIQYNFNEAAGPYTNSGSAGGTGSLVSTGAIGADSSGVSGLTGDREFNNNGGPAGNAISGVNGSGGVSHSADIDALDTATELTITGWYKSSDAISDLNTSSRILQDDGFILFGNNNTTDGGLLFQFLTTGGAVNAFSSFDSSFNQNDTWIFFAFSWDNNGGGGAWNFYNGTDTTSVVGQGSGTVTGTLLNGTTALAIGNGPGFNRPFDTSLDDIRIYNSSLDSTAIENIRLEAVPEPSTYALVLLGALSLYGCRRLNRRSQK